MSARDELNNALDRITELQNKILARENEITEYRSQVEREIKSVELAKSIAEEDDEKLDAMFCIVQTIMQSLSETATDPAQGGITSELFVHVCEQIKSITGRDIDIVGTENNDDGPQLVQSTATG